MIHQPSGGASGQATDISIHAKEILRMRELLTDMYAEHCTVAGEQRVDAKARFGGLFCVVSRVFRLLIWVLREGAGEGSFHDGARGVGVWFGG